MSDKSFNFQVGLAGTKNRDGSLDPDFQSCRLNPACFHVGKQVEYTHTCAQYQQGNTRNIQEDIDSPLKEKGHLHTPCQNLEGVYECLVWTDWVVRDNGKGKKQIRAAFVIGSAGEKMSLQLQADLGVNTVESFSPSPATGAR